MNKRVKDLYIVSVLINYSGNRQNGAVVHFNVMLYCQSAVQGGAVVHLNVMLYCKSAAQGGEVVNFIVRCNVRGQYRAVQ